MKQILCFGDSNTYGYIPGGNGRFDWGVRWTSILDNLVSACGYRVIEEGLCGRTTVFEDALRDGRRGTAMLPILLETHQPDAVVIMLGTNDCKRLFHATSEIITRGMENLINQVLAYNPDTRIIIVSPIEIADGISGKDFDPEFDEEAAVISRELPSSYRELALRYNIGYYAASHNASPSEIDKEHMDAAGHLAFGQGIGEYVCNYLAS